MTFASREAGSGHAPRLVVTTAVTPPTNVSAPGISGTPQQGGQLSATTGSWTGTDPISYAYQWQTCGPDGATCADIAGATTSVYTPSAADVGNRLRVTVTATNDAGTGSATSDSTAPVAPPPDTTPPSAPTDLSTVADESTIALVWTASTDDTAVAGYTLYLNGNQVTTAAASPYTFDNLTCDTSYTVGVDAYDSAGNHSTISTTSVQTAACPTTTTTTTSTSTTTESTTTGSTTTTTTTTDTEPPSQPSGLQVTAADQSSVSLVWTASTDDVGVAGYTVFVDGKQVGTAGQTSYSFANLGCDHSYTLGVDAYDAAGNHSGVATITAATAACPDTTPPTEPSNLLVTAADQTSITLTWSSSTDDTGVAGYTLYRDGNRLGTMTGTTHRFGNLSCNHSYTLGVDAYDAAHNHSTTATITAATSSCPDTTAPSPPSALQVTASDASSLSLSWTASTDDVGVAGYTLYLDGSVLTTTQQTTYAFANLNCDQSYTLGVDAYDAAGNHSTVATITSATSACADTTAPSPPSTLQVTAADQTSLTLDWNASTDDVGVSGYTLYLNGSKVGTSGQTSHRFANLTCDQTYTLGVDAFDAAGNHSTLVTTTAATAACSMSSGPCGGAGSAPGTYDHVVWVIFENHAYSQVIGSASAPYINKVAGECGLATNFFAESHPSLPNYLAMTSGSPQGVTDDGSPSSHPIGAASIFSQVGSWRALQESMPSNCDLGNSGQYYVKHNPAAYYTGVRSACGSLDVPLGSTPDISSKFTFVTPNICNDMHDCSVATGDKWLSGFLPKLLGSSEYAGGRTAIFVTWDEDDGGSSNHIATLVIAPSVPAGTQVSTRFNHYSMLRTTEEMLGINTYLGGAASATSMRSGFHF
jgi:phosphatidylinositol-3-phosphatase